MLGLLKAALVLAPVASALVRPEITLDPSEPIADHASAFVAVDIPDHPASRDIFHRVSVLGFRLDVLPSTEACGHANITVDGQTLPVKANGEVLFGKGPITTKRHGKVEATWTITCITVNGKHDSQFLKFHIDTHEGRGLTDIGFSTLFRQTGKTEILQINTDLRIPDLVAANPNPEALIPTDAAASPSKDVHDELRDLDWLMAQMHELKSLIAEKHQIIADHASEHFNEDIKDCDSLKCIVTTVAMKVKHVVHEVYEKIAGEDEFDQENFGHEHHRPHRGPGKWRGPGREKPEAHPHGPPYQPHGPPKHHNGTFPRKPHHWLPICRMPPPPHHRGGHHGPPPHGPPPHEKHPGGHHEPPPPPPHHGQERLHHGPEGLRVQPHHEGPPFDHGPPREPHGPPHPFDEGRPRHFGPLIHILQFTAIGFLAAFLLAALHRRACTPKRKASRKARREARRARRRSVHKSLISRLLARMAGSDYYEDDYEEKPAALLSDMEDGLSTTMTEEIEQLHNAASVVDDMVCHEEGRCREGNENFPLYFETEASSHLLDPSINHDASLPVMYDQLPAYDDNDESETNSMVSDGFRYTPGSTQYTPSDSDNGSVSDILGPDTKS